MLISHRTEKLKLKEWVMILTLNFGTFSIVPKIIHRSFMVRVFERNGHFASFQTTIRSETCFLVHTSVLVMLSNYKKK